MVDLKMRAAATPSQGATGGRSAEPRKRERRNRILGRLVLVIVSLLIVLGAAEWALRSLWPVGGCILRLDAPLLYAPIANSSHVQFFSENVGGGHAVISINSDGFRGPELSKVRDRPRWMVFGDSFVMGENETYENTFAARLGKHWDGRREVICAGVSGYGPDQNLIRMEQLLPKHLPDGVILVLCSSNDLGDPVRNHLVGLDDQGVLVRGVAHLDSADQTHFMRALAQAQKPGLVRLWDSYHELRDWAAPRRPGATLMADYLRAHREDFEAHALYGEDVVHGVLRDFYDADVAIRPEWKSSQYKVRLAEAILVAIRRLCEELKIPLFVVVAPNGVDLDPESWKRIDKQRYPSYRADRLCSTWAGIGERAGLPTLNLYEDFASRAKEEDLFVGALDTHWNARGMELGAQLCAQYLASLEHSSLGH